MKASVPTKQTTPIRQKHLLPKQSLQLQRGVTHPWRLLVQLLSQQCLRFGQVVMQLAFITLRQVGPAQARTSQGSGFAWCSFARPSISRFISGVPLPLQMNQLDTFHTCSLRTEICSSEKKVVFSQLSVLRKSQLLTCTSKSRQMPPCQYRLSRRRTSARSITVLLGLYLSYFLSSLASSSSVTIRQSPQLTLQSSNLCLQLSDMLPTSQMKKIVIMANFVFISLNQHLTKRNHNLQRLPYRQNNHASNPRAQSPAQMSSIYILYNLPQSEMQKHTNHTLGSLFVIFSLLALAAADEHPIDVVNGREYKGDYTALQPGSTFNYFDGRSGRLIAIFYGQPNRDSVNSLDLFLMDPRYEDGKMVLIQIKGIIEVGSNDSWVNEAHQITYTTIWKERVQDTYQMEDVSTTIKFQGLEQDDPEAVVIDIAMSGSNFNFTASLTYDNEILSTLAYSLYVTAVVGIQIYSGFVLVKIMDMPNFVFTAKMSLLTLSLCNIQDFSQTMNHIQYIMGSESGYLFFILPSLSYIILFIIFDMKMLFLVWRSHNLRNIDQPQVLRKRLTAFYIQFYLGLFVYLTLIYFFSNDQWMIILRNLILVPQIIHNVRMGNNPGFNPFYVFGFIGSRLLIPMYERLCPANRFNLTPSITLVVILLGLYVLEVLLLYLQYRLGSRFFVPKRFQPNYFNYKQKLHLNEQNRDMDCSICLQNLFQASPTNVNTSSLDSSLIEEPLQREVTVMTTPCKHNFHEECLTQWMEVKLECPTCRTQLPPL